MRPAPHRRPLCARAARPGTGAVGLLLTLTLWLAALAGFLASPAVRAAEDFLEPTQAFRGSVRALDATTLEVRYDIEPGYYLYRERFGVEPAEGGAQVGAIAMPAGKVKFDETFQKDVETYRNALVVAVPLAGAAGPFRLQVHYQGCADKGLCYPPATAAADVAWADGRIRSVRWIVDAEATPFDAAAVAGGGGVGALFGPGGAGGAGALSGSGGTGSVAASSRAADPSGAAATTPGVSAAAAPPASVGPADDEGGRLDRALRSGNLLLIAAVFAAAGVLLSFTPCVLPMVPILSSIIVGGHAPVSRARGFGLALSYALGMALVYTVFGVVAGLLGEGLAAALQNPWVLGAFALLLVALSLSMFGVYELQAPAALQSRLSAASNRLPGGRHGGVFLMGGLSALIVGPCVAAPLAGALVYISQTRDVVIGGLALFSLACGMSVPLLLVGLSAGSLLPKVGAWMQTVKTLFGVLLLGVALWIVSPVLPGWAVMALLGIGALLGAVYLRVFDRLPEDAAGGRRLGKGLGAVLAVVGIAQIVGALSGGQSALQPLRHLAGVTPSAVAAARPVDFQRIRTVAELDAALQSAGRPVMLDFYADWCVSCKEMEHNTFSDPAIRQRLGGALLLQADVTANTADDKALLKRFGLFGPPGILFFDPQGREQAPARVIGYLDPEAFGRKLSQAGL